MPRRPPQYPLHRGLIWRGFTLDASFLGDPFAEWAYVTPKNLDGVGTSALGRATKHEQIEVARFWFLSNCEPFIKDGRWFSFGREGSGFGQAPMAPSYYPPGILLREEFTGTIPDDALATLMGELEAQAGLWMFIPSPPQTMLATPEQGLASLQAAVETALVNVESAAQAAQAVPASIGHNQGPPFLDARLREELIQAVRLTQEGVAAKELGAPSAEQGLGRLRNVMAVLGLAILGGIGKHAGEDIYNAALPAALGLFHSLNEAVMVLGHWLAMYPPSPLL